MNKIGRIVVVFLLLFALPLTLYASETSLDTTVDDPTKLNEESAFDYAATTSAIIDEAPFTASLQNNMTKSNTNDNFQISFSVHGIGNWNSMTVSVVEADDREVLNKPVDKVMAENLHSEPIYSENLVNSTQKSLQPHFDVANLKLNYTYHVVIAQENDFEKQELVTPFQIVDPYGEGAYLAVGKTYSFITSPTSSLASTIVYEREPNDTIATGQLISSTDNTIFGNVSSSDQYDHFRIVAPDSGSLIALLSPQSYVADSMTIMIGDAQGITSYSSRTAYGVGRPGLAQCTVRQGETYDICVINPDWNGSVSYKLHIMTDSHVGYYYMRPVGYDNLISAYYDLDRNVGSVRDVKNGVVPNYWTSGRAYDQHKGTDYAGYAPVYAAAGGVVKTIVSNQGGSTVGFGNYVEIQHDTEEYYSGWTTIYAHLSTVAGLSVGDPVVRGTFLGYTGNTGESDGVHLHFQYNHQSLGALCPIDEGMLELN